MMAGMAKYTEEDFKTTNYKKIMRMSQTELASFLHSCFTILCPPGYKAKISCICPCTKCWYDWLSEEEEE